MSVYTYMRAVSENHQVWIAPFSTDLSGITSKMGQGPGWPCFQSCGMNHSEAFEYPHDSGNL